MAMGRETWVQDDLVASWTEMPRSPGNAFYDRLQALLKEAGFDAFVEALCKPYYAAREADWATRACGISLAGLCPRRTAWNRRCDRNRSDYGTGDVLLGKDERPRGLSREGETKPAPPPIHRPTFASAGTGNA